MTIDQIIDKLQLGVKYRQNAELGYGDCATLLKHITDLKDAISAQNSALAELKQAATKVIAVSTNKKSKKQKA